jgi:hypothetical protein
MPQKRGARKSKSSVRVNEPAVDTKRTRVRLLNKPTFGGRPISHLFSRSTEEDTKDPFYVVSRSSDDKFIASTKVDKKPEQSMLGTSGGLSSPMSSLVDPNQVYRFRLGGHSVIAQTTSGCAGFFAADPSSAGVNFPEYSQLQQLFSEMKLVEFACTFIQNKDLAGAGVYPPLLIATNLGLQATPTLYSQLSDNASWTWYNHSDTSKSGHRWVMKANKLNWSATATPVVDPYAGAPGSIQYFSTSISSSTADAEAYHVIVEGVYDFTIRV